MSPQKISEYDNTKPKITLFKGGPGVGKTRAAGSYPRVYFLSTDRKVGVLKATYPDSDIEFDIFMNFWDVYKRLEELEGDCRYQTVVIDTLTSLAQMAIDHSMLFRPEERKDSKGKELGRSKGQLMLPEIEDYGAEARGLQMCIDKLKIINLKWNAYVILIAHILTIEGKDKRGNTVFSSTLWTAGKKIAAAIPGDFDEIYHFEVRPGLTSDQATSYIAHTHHEGDNFARTTLDIPNQIDFTNKNFFEELQKNVK